MTEQSSNYQRLITKPINPCKNPLTISSHTLASPSLSLPLRSPAPMGGPPLSPSPALSALAYMAACAIWLEAPRTGPDMSAPPSLRLRPCAFVLPRASCRRCPAAVISILAGSPTAGEIPSVSRCRDVPSHHGILAACGRLGPPS